LEICPGGRCSNQARAVSERNRGRLRMMRNSSGLVSPEYFVIVVGGQNRVGNGARRMARLKACGPGGSGEGLRSSPLS
jgi:hypothetical protein